MASPMNSPTIPRLPMMILRGDAGARTQLNGEGSEPIIAHPYAARRENVIFQAGDQHRALAHICQGSCSSRRGSRSSGRLGMARTADVWDSFLTVLAQVPKRRLWGPYAIAATRPSNLKVDPSTRKTLSPLKTIGGNCAQVPALREWRHLKFS